MTDQTHTPSDLSASRGEAGDKFWIELREPGKVPERKGSFPRGMLVSTLREVFSARPEAFISVVTVGTDGPEFQDGPECLMMYDGRSRSVALRHILSSKAAHASAGKADPAPVAVPAELREASKKATPGEWNIAGQNFAGSVNVALGSVQKGWNGTIAHFDAGDYARSKSEGLSNAKFAVASTAWVRACIAAEDAQDAGHEVRT